MASNIKSKKHDPLQGITLAKIGTKREKVRHSWRSDITNNVC